MKMKKLIVVLLAAALAITPAFAAEEDIWAQLEDNYYQDIPQTRSDLDTHDFLQSGDTLDTSRSVERHSTDFDLSTQAGVNTFLTDMAEGGKLYDHLVEDGRILIYVENDNGENGMAILNTDKDEIVGYHQGDQGEMMLMELNDGVKSALTGSGIELASIRSYQLCLNGLCYGILYTDGETEMFQPISAVPGFMSEDTAYTMEELVELVEEHADTLTRFEGVNANLDPEKANVITGSAGGSEAADEGEKANVDTGR